MTSRRRSRLRAGAKWVAFGALVLVTTALVGASLAETYAPPMAGSAPMRTVSPPAPAGAEQGAVLGAQAGRVAAAFRDAQHGLVPDRQRGAVAQNRRAP
jgi:hypothetical protein